MVVDSELSACLINCSTFQVIFKSMCFILTTLELQAIFVQKMCHIAITLKFQLYNLCPAHVIISILDIKFSIVISH